MAAARRPLEDVWGINDEGCLLKAGLCQWQYILEESRRQAIIVQSAMAKSKSKQLAWCIAGWGAAVAIVIALIQSNGNLSRFNVVLLGILGTLFFFIPVLGLRWHKAPFPIGTPLRAILLFVVCAGLMTAVCWHGWPQSAEEVQAGTKRIIQEALNETSHYRVNVQPCRSEKLADCSDEQLFQWGQSLLEQIGELDGTYLRSVKATEGYEWDMKTKLNNAAALDLAKQFKNCCAVDALRYLKEIQSRVGGGLQDQRTTEWLEGITEPPSLFKKFFGTTELTEMDALNSSVASMRLFLLQSALERKIKKSVVISF
jgi:hypothetical protein